MSYEDILNSESDVLDMMKSIKKLEDKLENGKFVDEIYDIGKTRQGAKFAAPAESEKIAAQMSEMKNFDNILKLKFEEMKTAKMERMRAAEESTQLLTELSETETSEAVKNNFQQFLKLLQNEVNEYSSETVNSSKTTKPIKKSKVRLDENGKKPGTFIERNIQLAKCGDGVLSLTDEEKLRLKIVLKDIDESTVQSADPNKVIHIPTDNQYVLNDEEKKILDEIDRKLEEHEKTKFSLDSIRSSVVSIISGDGECGKEKCRTRIRGDVENELFKLKEVDKLLNSFNSTTNEEIDPLLDEHLQYLIKESKQYLTPSPRVETSNSNNSIGDTFEFHPMPSNEEMVELISAARNNMPNFKFKYEF